MIILDPVDFDGTIEAGEASIPVRFTASIDGDGNLQLAFAAIPPSRAAVSFIPEQRALEPLVTFRLKGQAAEAWTFESEAFYVSRWSRLPNHVEIEGYCGVAELSRPATPDQPDLCAWFYRKLAAIHGMSAPTALGNLVLRGYKEDADQEPVSLLALHGAGHEDDHWWEEAERLLIHVQRVLSLGCAVYLLPVYKQRFRAGRMTLRLAQRARAPNPYLEPFRSLYMEQIFGCAVLSFIDHGVEVERLDPAIRWLTAPVALQEARLINAMSALECVLATSQVAQFHLPDVEAFNVLRKDVAKHLKALKAPSRMSGKLRELNRRSFTEKLEDLLDQQPFPTTDFPAGWLKAALEARNVIIHTGISPDMPATDASLLDHVVRVRDLVIRLILAAIGFTGQYQSWLHRCADISFPACSPVDRVRGSAA